MIFLEVARMTTTRAETARLRNILVEGLRFRLRLEKLKLLSLDREIGIHSFESRDVTSTAIHRVSETND
jgi:hypothetical protein